MNTIMQSTAVSSHDIIHPTQASPVPPLPICQTAVDDPTAAILTDTKMKIKRAGVAGIIIGVFTLLATLSSLGGGDIAGVNVWTLIDVVIVLALSIGVFFRSRICAAILLAHFVIGKLMLWQAMGKPTGWPLALVLGWLLFEGVRGTFTWHRLKKQVSGSI